MRTFIFTVLLAGCAMQKIDPAVLAESQVPLTCATKQQCDLYWQRAQAYINQHSAFKIQTATDTVLATYGPIDSSTNLTYNLTKIPKADGTATIDVNLSCSDFIIGCSPNAPTETINLKRFVQAQ